MTKEYIKINRKAYDALALEYKERSYSVGDDFYKNEMFAGLGLAKSKKMLEIGPGIGARLKDFCDYELDVTAIELSSEMSKLCHHNAPEAKIINKNVFECDFDYQFDFIYMGAVIHNFPIEEAKKLLKLIYNWLKDDGIFICATTVDQKDYEDYQEKKDYISKLKRFRHHYTKESFEELFLQNNFNIVNKKYKEEVDESRKKLWQIIYAKKQK